MSKRTITLTGRRPVTIEEDNWPVIAQASDAQHDSHIASQSNRTSKWWIKVRLHEDGRAIVYAGYSYDNRFQGARCYEHKAGVLLPKTAAFDTICRSIINVAHDMEQGEHDGEDASRWKRLADECIADMPAEELD